jgi:NAD(P)-dependent dehydrogenase (short-subunit alcohol dehydrogenase family)
MGRLDGKVAVITGGASGIGEASVRLFVEEGARTVIADIQEDKGHALAEEIGAASATFVRTDVVNDDDIKGAVRAAVDRFGRLDCMFNNGGIPGPMGGIDEIDMDAYDKAMAILLRAVFVGTKHAATVMKAQSSGSIVNTSSLAGLKAIGAHVYGTAKAGVIYLTRSTAMELGESGVRVNCICPGAIVTPIWATGPLPGTFETLEPILKQAFVNAQPVRRAGLPEDIARAALWLASDDASFVNGVVLPVDGGLSGGDGWTETIERARRAGEGLAGVTSTGDGNGLAGITSTGDANGQS